jgi:ribonuclease G
MSKELVISANRHETKVAILEDDQLVEVYFQRANEYSLAGSIHKGRVTRVLPGMQSAFVDLGLDRDTFLYVSDFFEENEEYDRIVEKDARPERGPRQAPPEPRVDRPVEPSVAPVKPEEAVADKVEAGTPAPLTGERTDRPERSDRPESDDGRDRRGRRSRRRRNRGRGFPESKYASETRYGATEVRGPDDVRHNAPVAESAPPVEREQVTAGEPGRDFSILPGESLAKYSRSSIPPLDEQEEEEIRSAQKEHEVAGQPEAPEPAETTASATETVAEPEPEPPAAHHETAAAAEELAVQEPEELDEIEAIADAEVIAEADAEAEAENETEFQAGAEPGVQSEPGAGPGNTPTPAGQSQQLTANIREQGGRYMHRMPRRMRRRMRQGGPEGRTDQEHRGEVVSISSSEPAAKEEPSRQVSRPVEKSSSSSPSITELLKEGQEIIVQIAKEPLGQKGARITSHIALPGRYVVYMPTLDHMGVSRKIASDEERLRLKRILQAHRAGVPGGLIIRTAGEGKSEEEISADINFLFNLWLDMRQKAEKKPAPVLLHHDLDIVQRTLRDQITDSYKSIWVDNEEVYESILRFAQRFQPGLVTRVKLYTRPAPIFDAFNITAELEKALRPKVWLKSGGYIVINQTEALVAIDVNTGKYVGKSNRLEDTIVKTNTEAVKEIVRQVRLRDLGGIIVVDFIDMDERKNRQKVMQALEDAMRSDRAPNKILQFNDFGLVAITRKRVKQSLERTLCSPCPYCDSAGYVKSVQTVIGEILQEANKIVAAVQDQKEVVLRVHPEVAKVLKSHHNKYLEELEETVRRPVLVKGDASIHQEKFDLA